MPCIHLCALHRCHEVIVVSLSFRCFVSFGYYANTRSRWRQQWRWILDQPMIKSSTICQRSIIFGCQSKASITSYLLIYVFSKYLILVYCIRFQYILVDRVLLHNALPRYLDPLLLANLGSACACVVARALYLLCLAMHLLSSGHPGYESELRLNLVW